MTERKVNVVFGFLSHLSKLSFRVAVGTDTTKVEEMGVSCSFNKG